MSNTFKITCPSCKKEFDADSAFNLHFEKAKKDAAEKASRGWFGLGGGKKKPDDDDDEEDYEEQEANYTLQVSAKRLEAQRRETEQLFYCLSGAGIFFKRTDVETE